MATAPIPNCEIRAPKATGVSLTIPDGSIQSDHISATGGEEIVAAKVHHRHHCGTDFHDKIGDTPTAKEYIVYTARGTETIIKFAALLNDTGTSTDIDFALKKNGSTLMSSDLTITHAEADREVVDGTAFLSSTALAAGDVLSVATVITASTGALGPYAWVEIDSIGE